MTLTFPQTKLQEMRQKLVEYRTHMTMDNVIGKIISQHLKSGNQVSAIYRKAMCFLIIVKFKMHLKSGNQVSAIYRKAMCFLIIVKTKMHLKSGNQVSVIYRKAMCFLVTVKTNITVSVSHMRLTALCREIKIRLSWFPD